jgi:hypothetical protein
MLALHFVVRSKIRISDLVQMFTTKLLTIIFDRREYIIMAKSWWMLWPDLAKDFVEFEVGHCGKRALYKARSI